MGKRLLGRCRHRWEDILRMDIKEIDVRVIVLIQLRIGITGESL